MNGTSIRIPGREGIVVDLLKIPVRQACRAINAWETSCDIFKDGDFHGLMQDRHPGWSNAKRELLKRKLARVTPDGLVPVKKRLPKVQDAKMA